MAGTVTVIYTRRIYRRRPDKDMYACGGRELVETRGGRHWLGAIAETERGLVNVMASLRGQRTGHYGMLRSTVIDFMIQYISPSA